MSHFRRWGAVDVLLGAKHLIFKVDAEDLERIEAKVDYIKESLGLPTPPPS